MRFENNCFLPATDSSDLYTAEKGTEVISGGFVVVVHSPPPQGINRTQSPRINFVKKIVKL